MENDLSAEELSTPVTITRGELNQLSHAFNNYQAMAEQVQSLATQIAQLRLLTATPASTPESSTIRTATLSQVPKVLQPDLFTGDRLELDTYLTCCQHVFLTQPSLFLIEQHKVLYAASYLKDNAYSWVKPLVQEYAKGASTQHRTFIRIHDQNALTPSNDRITPTWNRMPASTLPRPRICQHSRNDLDTRCSYRLPRSQGMHNAT